MLKRSSFQRLLKGIAGSTNFCMSGTHPFKLGHFGFFRRACRDTLWSELLARILPLAEEQRATSRRS